MRHCPECGWPKEAHTKPPQALRPPPPPHSGGRPPGAPPTRSCILEEIPQDDPEYDGPRHLRPAAKEYRTALAAADAYREEFRDEDEEESVGPNYAVERGPRLGSGVQGRFRPGEVRSAA